MLRARVRHLVASLARPRDGKGSRPDRNSNQRKNRNQQNRNNKPQEGKENKPHSALDISKILAAVTEATKGKTVQKSYAEIRADATSRSEAQSSKKFEQMKAQFAKTPIPDLGWYEPNVLEKKPVSLVPEYHQAQREEYQAFRNQCYDDGYNKQWSSWLNNSYVQLPTTNETGERAAELNVPWQEHVFFDEFVSEFPKGQIRTFMEAAAAGLSQNPFLSIDEKHEHLEFFRQYFVEREADLIQSSIIAKKGELPRDEFITPDGDGKWPSQVSVMKRYEEMTPWGKDWYDLKKGPMTFRIRKRRHRLAQLENVEAAKKLELEE